MSQPSRPTPVTAAVALLWIAAVVSALVAVLFFVAAGNETELLKVAGERGVDPSMLRATNLVIASAALVGAVVYVVFALTIGGGRRVARLVYTILAVLGILGNAASALQSGQWYHWLVVVIPLVIIVLLWGPKSSQEFFARPAEA